MTVYPVSAPEQLKAIAAYAKEGSPAQLAAVWNAARRKGNPYWEDRVKVVFSGGRNREAAVTRTDNDGAPVICARLKYTPALKWCQENMEQEGR